MMRRIFFVVMLGLAGCSESKFPKGVLEPEKMQAVYWDYIKADVFANEFVRRDTSKNIELENAKLQLQVFRLHKTTKEQFYKSYEYYLKNKDLMKAMLDTMVVRQRAHNDSLLNKKKILDSLKTKPVLFDTTAKAL
ncbi:MAG: DUF4296 domain-containing protein [Sphingobacteriales bacterium]|nr:MAG: DUF4296 domain-containing protein [Sphingobacteriales bacterium]